MNRDYDDFQSKIISSLEEIFDDFCDNDGLINLDETRRLIETSKNMFNNIIDKPK